MSLKIKSASDCAYDALALGEVMRPLQTLGIVLVLVAIVVVQMPDRRLHEEVTVVEPIE